jgi:hypothetical protein
MITDKRKIKQTLYYVNVLEKNSFFFTKLEIEKISNSFFRLLFIYFSDYKLDLFVDLNT